MHQVLLFGIGSSLSMCMWKLKLWNRAILQTATNNSPVDSSHSIRLHWDDKSKQENFSGFTQSYFILKWFFFFFHFFPCKVKKIFKSPTPICQRHLLRHSKLSSVLSSVTARGVAVLSRVLLEWETQWPQIDSDPKELQCCWIWGNVDHFLKRAIMKIISQIFLFPL